MIINHLENFEDSALVRLKITKIMAKTYISKGNKLASYQYSKDLNSMTVPVGK